MSHGLSLRGPSLTFLADPPEFADQQRKQAQTAKVIFSDPILDCSGG